MIRSPQVRLSCQLLTRGYWDPSEACPCAAGVWVRPTETLLTLDSVVSRRKHPLSYIRPNKLGLTNRGTNCSCQIPLPLPNTVVVLAQEHEIIYYQVDFLSPWVYLIFSPPCQNLTLKLNKLKKYICTHTSPILLSYNPRKATPPKNWSPKLA